jgi:hypothetical protein
MSLILLLFLTPLILPFSSHPSYLTFLFSHLSQSIRLSSNIPLQINSTLLPSLLILYPSHHTYYLTLYPSILPSLSSYLSLIIYYLSLISPPIPHTPYTKSSSHLSSHSSSYLSPFLSFFLFSLSLLSFKHLPSYPSHLLLYLSLSSPLYILLVLLLSTYPSYSSYYYTPPNNSTPRYSSLLFLFTYPSLHLSFSSLILLFTPRHSSPILFFTHLSHPSYHYNSLHHSYSSLFTIILLILL